MVHRCARRWGRPWIVAKQTREELEAENARLAGRLGDLEAAAAKRIGAALDVIIERPQQCDPDRRLAKHLADQRHALLTFLADPAVDATNWRAAVSNSRGL